MTPIDRLDRLLEPGRLLGGALMERMLHDQLGVSELQPGQALGSFRIERELGRGGMGIVYLATRADGAYEQQVAIKWLPMARAGSRHVDQFQRERQILAQLRHPNIAHLLDGGRSEDGHLWFALEHVEGLPVDQHAALHCPDWASRVQLLLPVVEAVQFAHGRLLVHRDIKPDNVLVAADGRPQLIDFGIAALLADDDAPVGGTPGFASPEQLAGAPLDTTSDIWQLGRLLQCVLLAAADAPPPSRLPEDLQAIIAKACAQAPEQRYPTAAALLDDLQCWLKHRPVSARRPSTVHRLRLLLQAHPLGSMATGVALIAFLGLTVGFMWRLARERDAAQHAQYVAETVNRFIEEDFLPGADPLQGGSSDLSVADLSERALNRVEPRLRHLPEVAGQVELSLGLTLANLGRQDAARRAYSQAILHLSEAFGPHHARVLQARLARAQASLDGHDLHQAESHLLALRKEAMTYLGAQDPLVDDVDMQIAHAAFQRDDFTLCKARYTSLLTRLQGGEPTRVASAHSMLGMCEARLGNGEAAVTHAEQARDLNARELGNDNPLTLETGIVLETALASQGRFAEAAAVLQPLLERLRSRYGPLHPTTLVAAHDLGLTTGCAGNTSDGITWLQHAVAGRQAALGEGHPWLAMSQSVLAMMLIQAHRLQEAERSLKDARRNLGDQGQALSYVLLTLQHNEADLALAQGQAALAIKRYQAAMATARTLYFDQHRIHSNLNLGLGLALYAQGQQDAGLERIRQALERLGQRADCRSGMIAAARSLLSG